MPSAVETRGTGLRLDPSCRPGAWRASLAGRDDLHEDRSPAEVPGAGEPAGLPALSVATEGECTVIFDGVLYNATELVVSARACAPETSADVVLQAYRRWGPRSFERLRGVFAVLVRDGDTLFALRDPMGVHPLFHCDTGRERLFSPYLDELVRHPQVSRDLDRVVLASRLCDQWTDAEGTCYAQVKRVPPGHVLRISGTSTSLCRYWDPAPRGAPVDWIEEDAAEQFSRAMDQAIGRCLGLGSAGIFLSGGIDSVSVAALAVDICRRHNHPAPLALSMVYPHPDCNEEAVQSRTARDLQIPQVLTPFDEAVGPRGSIESALAAAREWPWPLLGHWTPAFGSLGVEGARRGCRVILTGGGGDEWLGVSPFLSADLIRRGDVRSLWHLMASTRHSYRFSFPSVLCHCLWRFGARRLLDDLAVRTGRRLAPAVLWGVRQRRASRAIPRWVAPDPFLRRELEERAAATAEEESRQRQAAGSHYAHEARRSLDHPLVGMEMEDAFENGRRIGVRILQPYWDPDVVDVLYRTPPAALNQGDRFKGLVRETLARRFPTLGFDRQKKVAFTSFYRERTRHEGAAAWTGSGGVPELHGLGIVDEPAFRQAVEQILSGARARYSYYLWEVLCVSAWVRAHA